MKGMRARYCWVWCMAVLLLGSTVAMGDWNYEPDDPCDKWIQMPDETTNGIDIRCDDFDGIPRFLADDFECTETDPITNIHLWTSWYQDLECPIDSIRLSIWSDIPDPDGDGPLYSMPDVKLWEYTFTPGQWAARQWSWLYEDQFEWFWDPWNGSTVMPNPRVDGDKGIWQFNFRVPDQERFVQQGTPEQPIVYWLGVEVFSATPDCSDKAFGWKTRDPFEMIGPGDGHWNDDAVYGQNDGPSYTFYELVYPDGHPYQGDSIDLSFVLEGPGEPAIDDIDFGDAPDPMYPTLLANNGARHGIVQSVYLGNQIDPESDGQPTPAADGDDLSGLADEDGVVFTSAIMQGQNATVDVTASVSGYLNAWIDFNNDGDWADAGEQIFTDKNLTSGLNSINFNVPSSALIGSTFARFRFDTVGGVTYTGQAIDGEVEDYQVMIEEGTGQDEYDFGDAPDTPYPTLLANNGARHVIMPGVYMGALIDPDADGQPTPAADGDDLGDGNDDEDGVVFTSAIQIGQIATVDVTVSVSGYLNAWMDFNNDGDWADAGEQIFTDKAVTSGLNSLSYSVPSTAVVAAPAARFRFDTAGGLSYTGQAPDGEVEDYEILIEEGPQDDPCDFGDAPDSYQTRLASDGPRHVIGNLYLGSAIDGEADGQPTPAADGDDNNNVDDEDGVTFPSPIVSGLPGAAYVVSSGAGFVDAWIDYDINGIFEPHERIFLAQPVVAGLNRLTFIPQPGQPFTVGTTYARFRLTSTGGIMSFGPAFDGEVEDYQVQLEEPGVPVDTTKWIQWPDLSTDGIDVKMTPPNVLADDFRCTAHQKVTDISVWASWLNDELPEGSASNVDFFVSIHADIPADESPNGYSEPGDELWSQHFQAGTFTVTQEHYGQEGWWDPMAPGSYNPQGDFYCWRYDFTIDSGAAFCQEGTLDNPRVYWLVVQAMPVFGQGTEQIGWKTSTMQWNDNAVFDSDGQTMPPPFNGPWSELYYPTLHSFEGQPLDLAFRIGGDGQLCCLNTADINRDGSVDLLDVREMARKWLWVGAPGGVYADVDCDGKVDLYDFYSLVQQW